MMRHRVSLLLLVVVGLLAAVPALAQYRVHTWESFESGDVPQGLIRGHQADATTVFAYNYQSAGTPRMMTSGIASLECADYGVMMKPTGKKLHLSMVSPTSLDRRQLGAVGKALYQADVYIPEEGVPFPNTALLAVVAEPVEKGFGYKMYRFGISEAVKSVYFAYANDSIQKTAGAPIIYKNQNISELKLKRPGWHRLQMIFVGQQDIYCAIDTAATSFSPIREPSLSVLNAGLMVAGKGDNSCIVDNLSIQWSFENIPLPDSPWLLPLANANIPNENLMESGSSVFWLSDPQKAWKLATAQKRPILIQYHVPRMPTYMHLKAMTPNDEATQNLLNRFVLLKVDVNQLGGGTLAQRYGIVRVPTFMVMGPDGKEMRRLAVTNTQTTWAQVKETLASGLLPKGTPAATSIGGL